MIKGLHHVAIAVQDFEAARDGYARLFGFEPMAQDGDGARRAWFWFDNMGLEIIAPDGVGDAGDRVRTRLGDAGEGLWLVAFWTEDFDAAAKLCERRGLVVSQRTERAVMFEPWSTGGVQIALMSFPPLEPRAKGPIPALDHVVIRTAAIDRAVATFGGRLGLDLRLDRVNQGFGAHQLFFRCGGAVVEFAADLKAPASDEPDSFGGLAWRMDDGPAAHAAIAAAGFNVSELRTGRKPGTHVFTVRDAPAGVPTILLSAEPAPQVARSETA